MEFFFASVQYLSISIFFLIFRWLYWKSSEIHKTDDLKQVLRGKKNSEGVKRVKLKE